jgi:hypothetical protein
MFTLHSNYTLNKLYAEGLYSKYDGIAMVVENIDSEAASKQTPARYVGV